MNSKNQDNQPLILLKIQTKQGISFNDRVRAITSFNEKGIFDVLPQHENFISVIKDKIIIHTEDGGDKEMKIDNGVLKVYENEAHIFLGLAEV
ncbi:MAG: hypothetical protein A3H50_02935 [Candidatus Levybacteria bacterium RIFCSPLOWO2_02_FULL_37_10]|nr:MAG: hypothetical protein A2860_02485 [Candidatus Levybacteria bacterium RIFCSPHIGHO2_01_FULL_37_33]OGH15685.1 MAG: hypothetical protein A3C97_00820 [Candidatus Levybacteria bacterium RIFCSPHIGHO2_02_FULL_37_11]OGH30207.1 MAG: hypothetical protein A3F30_04455 [Candidatus Levybacteria bacterium RIFCSPHIGHO2_12_FULL_37_12]OGH33224.1 MAG: hypothetical protein A2953_00755 [Candidatus Levybacteria bacterium RIFCSPLOWO2_01_FULL_36_54]OGH43119.1 MAG: hypothetical protein A3H50_02935 [Candidatus Lev